MPDVSQPHRYCQTRIFVKQEHTRKKYFTFNFTDFFEEYINYVIKHELLSGFAIDN